MSYLGNLHNLARANPLTLAISGVVASSTVYALAKTKTGGGNVRLTGAYTGATDATYDIEVLNNTIVGTPRVSTPVFTGVGNGAMTSVSASGAVAAQEVRVTLVDLGTDTLKSYVPFQLGVTLRAKVAGSGGNALTIDVSESGITRSATDDVLLEDLTADQNEYIGDQWNFGAAALDENGKIPPSAPRISFGDDPQVYRAYKQFKAGRYVYSFSPAPVRTVNKGAKVKAVSGSRSITVANTTGAAASAFIVSHAYTLGTAVHPITPNGHWYKVTVAGTTAGSEPTYPTNGGTVVSGTATLQDMGVITTTYGTITTLYSFLAAIKADAAALIEVDGPAVNDLAPGGMGAVEMSVRTTSYMASQIREGTQFVINADIGLTVGATQPTEELVIRCKNADVPGLETWEVRGSGLGLLAEATTALAYSNGGYGFTIPEQLPPATSPTANLAAHLEYVSPANVGNLPTLCFRDFVAGADAVTKRFVYTWTPHAVDCPCETSEIEGGPDDVLLGIDPQGGSMSTIPTELKTPLAALYDWSDTFIKGNTALVDYDTVVEDTTIDADVPGTVIVDAATGTTDSSTAAVTRRKERVSAVLKADRVDVDFAKRVTAVFHGALRAVYDENLPGLTAAQARWDTEFAALQADCATINDLIGADFWRKYSTFMSDHSAEDDSVTEALYGAKLLTQDIELYLERYKSAMRAVCVAGDVEPDFDGAGRGGNHVWQDHGDPFWFVSEDGYLPIQLNHYYHSCKMVDPGDGTPVPTSTREFGIGINVGCQLSNGDKLIIEITADGNIRQTYQIGDTITSKIISARQLELGGGQTGTDALTFSVIGSVAGGFADYTLSKISPAAYSNGGLGFAISIGGIPYGLGAAYSFYVEGGQFKWRKNGGSYSSATQIASTVSLSDGLSAAFDVGAAPSFNPGDIYNFAAEATFGIEKVRQPAGGKLKLSSANGEIIVDCSAATDKTVRGVLLAGHTLSSAATITYAASNLSDFSVVLYTHSLTALAPGASVGSPHFYAELPADQTANYHKITISEAGSIDWLWLGVPFEVEMPNGNVDLGKLVKRWQLPRATKARALGLKVDHSFATHDSVTDLLDMLAHSTQYDDSILAIVPNPSVAEVGLVRIDAESIDLTDAFDHQPADSDDYLISFPLELSPA